MSYHHSAAFDQAVSPSPQSCHEVASLGLIEEHSKRDEEFEGELAFVLRTLKRRPIRSLHCTRADSQM